MDEEYYKLRRERYESKLKIRRYKKVQNKIIRKPYRGLRCGVCNKKTLCECFHCGRILCMECQYKCEISISTCYGCFRRCCYKSYDYGKINCLKYNHNEDICKTCKL